MLNTCAWLKRLFIVTSKIMIGIQLHIYPIIRRHHFANQSPYSQSYGFSSRHIQMWELDLKEGRMSKNWCLWIIVLEKTPESPLDCKGKPVNPIGNQPWILIGRTDVEPEAPILWPPDVKSRLIGKDLMLGKTEGKRRRGWQRMRGLDIITNSMTWIWANSRRQRTGKSGVLQSMGWQRIRHNLVTEQQKNFKKKTNW